MGDSPAAVIVDATTGATATVLQPNTAPAATDKAQVVALSPNTPPISTAQTAHVDVGNSSNVALGAGATFTGTGLDVSNYSSVLVNYYTDAAGTLKIEFSSDGINWDFTEDYSIEAGVPNHIHTGWKAIFFRVVLINGPAPQSFLRLQAIQNSFIVAPHSQKLATLPQEDDDVILTKASLIGKTSSKKLPPEFLDILVDLFGSIQVGLRDVNGTPVHSTPFNELRVAAPYTLLDLVNKYEIDPNILGIRSSNGGSATFLPNQSAIKLTILDSPGSRVTLRTHTYFRYQAGRGLNAKLTLYHLDTGQPNEQRNWGFFDDDDGIMFRLDETTLQVGVRSSTSGAPDDSSFFSQVDWNIDKANGQGNSLFDIDITKGNIYEYEFQWLGVGVVNFYIDGILVHRIEHANLSSAPYMKTATLPLTWEVLQK